MSVELSPVVCVVAVELPRACTAVHVCARFSSAKVPVFAGSVAVTEPRAPVVGDSVMLPLVALLKTTEPTVDPLLPTVAVDALIPVNVVQLAPPRPNKKFVLLTQAAGEEDVSGPSVKRLNPLNPLFVNVIIPSAPEVICERLAQIKPWFTSLWNPPLVLITAAAAVIEDPELIAFEKETALVIVPATAGHVIVAEPLVDPNPVMMQAVVFNTPQENETADAFPDELTEKILFPPFTYVSIILPVNPEGALTPNSVPLVLHVVGAVLPDLFK